MLLLKSKSIEIINQLNNEINKLKYEIDEKNREINSLKSQINSLNLQINNLEPIKEKYYLLKSINNTLEYKFIALQNHYDYFADWINNHKCQLVRDTFFREKVELPLPISDEIVKMSETYKLIDKV